MSATCLILLVGTGIRGQHANLAQALIHALQRRRPERFLLLPSAARDSQAVAHRVLDRLDPTLRAALVPWSDEQMFPCLESHGHLQSARATVREVIRHVRDRFPSDTLVIHPASGSRQACVGAMLAALDEGVGVIEFASGAAGEKSARSGAPRELPVDAAEWLAGHDVDLSIRLWDQQAFSAAAAVLRIAAVRLPVADARGHRLSALALLAEGFAAKQTFQFATAERCFRECHKHLQGAAAECFVPLQTLDRIAKEWAERCARIAKAQSGDRTPAFHRELLTEIVDNSLRAARAEQYDEAAARLYRAMELDLQLRLAEATSGNYWNGRLTKGGKVPEALRATTLLTQLQRTELPREFSLEQMVLVLHALGDASVADLWQDLTDHRKHSEWREATASHHASILAHGCSPVEKADFKNLRRIAGRFLQLQLGESHPVPAFDRRWLEMPF